MLFPPMSRPRPQEDPLWVPGTVVQALGQPSPPTHLLLPTEKGKGHPVARADVCG